MLSESREVALPALVRPPHPSEAVRLGELWAHGLRQRGGHGARRRALDADDQVRLLRQRIEHNDPVFVAEVHKRLVGVAAARPRPRPTSRYAAELVAFCVEPAFQAEGIGRVLLDALQFAMNQRGMVGLVAWLPADSAARIAMLRLGADEVDRRLIGAPSRRQVVVAYAWPD